eukprot:CAMPEP_0172636112 /NCGR_PEP_ID=MMETSP1068-20121228/202419_1 /TAXON_ID=35684 /ORGANISM="Pseudopedinella elastica, Strain CCMP716" /LENGTH=56 /DNA_ID=CAMNT_0013448475 /DNA_START=16 /DNA_END=183 /DNA_ORIENTATION=+
MNVEGSAQAARELDFKHGGRSGTVDDFDNRSTPAQGQRGWIVESLPPGQDESRGRG